jgi:hypothetical protein
VRKCLLALLLVSPIQETFETVQFCQHPGFFSSEAVALSVAEVLEFLVALILSKYNVLLPVV